ncbi:MAG: Tex family protein [Bacteroidales bacterium]|nr:Tex family protein [Bacteroidales bacterium]HOI32895.1 Tex family protein [Bacteroidales bacterium]
MAEVAQFTPLIAHKLNLEHHAVRNVVQLLVEGATIPFIARYRKEMTGSLDETKILAIQQQLEKSEALEKRRKSILESIASQDKLTDELAQRIAAVSDMQSLEDLYLPYKPKRRTRATIAREKGLEPLAAILMKQEINNPESVAERFLNKAKELNSTDEALAGAMDIMAEWIAENSKARKTVREIFQHSALIKSTVSDESHQQAAVFQHYFDWSEPLDKAPSHRLLAIFRGEQQGVLKLKLDIDQEYCLSKLEHIFVRPSSTTQAYVQSAVKDSFRRLIIPSIETEVRNYYKAKADTKAIAVFAENLKQLLLAPPLGSKRVLAIDPGFRTGCKLVVLDAQGKLEHNDTIYPHAPQSETKQAIQKIKNLTNAYKTEVIAIGNGTAGRETEDLIRNIRFDRDMTVVMVNESGASVYSASAVAREEFPDYDITVRGAVSIGRRLMDPLAELVKIDPKSIGVGQYQHDVDQKALQQSLNQTVESCVNAVGVELNTASEQLLTYVSGLGPQLAKAIIEYRHKNGAFKSREELKKVPRLGQKAFEQCAGFLRIRNAENPLDASAVHPESYTIAEAIARKANLPIQELMGNRKALEQLDIKAFTNQHAGLETLQDIFSELEKPGRDPRDSFETMTFDKKIRTINDLREGMELQGIVTNITAFGAFVDIGVHQDGLVHISELANRYIKDPAEVVHLNQKVKVRILAVDVLRKRINLSMKAVL